ncbi:MAG: phosphate acyltransferase PlsX [Flavobacteriales bacterium]|nr:phosphate acyltransferase PlsX [Flavobacteriales bacterium]MBO72996.1 phosphate acyltransferase PlsX [Flavobacteriales bacterium]|tara:strand:+ start:296 stop:1231 length:936 start_codon:yes stop_codon:yes gene_type:complete
MRIGIDIMGGDFAPQTTTEGAVLAQKELSDVELVLIGDEPLISSILESQGADKSKFSIVHTTDIIGMGEHPIKAFKQKPKSSIGLGFHLLATGEIQGFAGAGNTGAMMIGSMYSVKSIPGIIRPCITSVLPKESGGVNLILDVGVNADCKPDVLYQFGIVGSVYAQSVLGIENPRVGLLNIGEEPEKGNLLSQASNNLMNDSKDFNFIGNIEGRDLFDDKCDVIVCDGFTGNVVLKEAEAFYYLMKKRGMLDDYFSKFNYEIYGGSPILGINSNVVVGHGISNSEAIKNMIMLTAECVEANLSKKIKEAFK